MRQVTVIGRWREFRIVDTTTTNTNTSNSDAASLIGDMVSIGISHISVKQKEKQQERRAHL